MRLLKYGEDGCLTIGSFNDDAIPEYAILSHTWGEDAEEVTFADLAQGGGGKHKAGYKKIYFCGEQAQQDRLQYFWVDTCCIDKSDKAELSHAIQSMFRWYQNATKCYVYFIRRIDKNEETQQHIHRLHLGASLQVKSMVHAWLDAPRASCAKQSRILLSRMGKTW
jgi:hypothetical protein